jgi:hypothetical protein
MGTMTNVQLSAIIKSPRTLSELTKLGFHETADLAHLTEEQLLDIKWVGATTLETLRQHIDFYTEPKGQGEIEEGAHDLEIQSPNPGQMLILLSGEKVGDARAGFKILPGVYLKCRLGRGQITRRMWFMRKFTRDIKRVEAAETNNTPWRVDAANWIRARKAYGVSYFLLD